MIDRVRVESECSSSKSLFGESICLRLLEGTNLHYVYGSFQRGATKNSKENPKAIVGCLLPFSLAMRLSYFGVLTLLTVRAF